MKGTRVSSLPTRPPDRLRQGRPHWAAPQGRPGTGGPPGPAGRWQEVLSPRAQDARGLRAGHCPPASSGGVRSPPRPRPPGCLPQAHLLHQPHQPAMCSEAKLEGGWTQPGGKLGPPPKPGESEEHAVTATVCGPTPRVRMSQRPRAWVMSRRLSHGSAGPAKASWAPAPQTCSLPLSEEWTQNKADASEQQSSLHRAALEPRALQSPDSPGEPGPAATPAVSHREASPGRRCQPSLPGPRQDLGKRMHKKSGNADDSTVATGRAVLSQSGDNLQPQWGWGVAPRVTLEREGPADQVTKKGGKVFKMRIEKKHRVSGG